jgi:hypothetical protein
LEKDVLGKPRTHVKDKKQKEKKEKEIIWICIVPWPKHYPIVHVGPNSKEQRAPDQVGSITYSRKKLCKINIYQSRQGQQASDEFIFVVWP